MNFQKQYNISDFDTMNNKLTSFDETNIVSKENAFSQKLNMHQPTLFASKFKSAITDSLSEDSQSLIINQANNKNQI